MLEFLVYVVLLLIVMPALLLGAGKLILSVDTRLASSKGVASSKAMVSRVTTPASQDYGTLHQRLVAAAEANPLMPKPSFRSGKTERRQ